VTQVRYKHKSVKKKGEGVTTSETRPRRGKRECESAKTEIGGNKRKINGGWTKGGMIFGINMGGKKKKLGGGGNPKIYRKKNIYPSNGGGKKKTTVRKRRSKVHKKRRDTSEIRSIGGEKKPEKEGLGVARAAYQRGSLGREKTATR